MLDPADQHNITNIILATLRMTIFLSRSAIETERYSLTFLD